MPETMLRGSGEVIPCVRFGSLALVVALAFSSRAQAVPIQWATGVNGDWDSESSWSPTQVPGPDDDVSISAPATRTYSISITAPATSKSLLIDAPARIFLFDALNTKDINLESGSLSFQGGTLTDATVHMNGGSIQPSSAGGVLSHVTIDGDLTLGQANATTLQQLTFSDSTVVSGTLSISSPVAVYLGQSGTINYPVNLSGGVLSFIGSQTVTLSPSVSMTLSGDGQFTDQIGSGSATVTNLGTISASGGRDPNHLTNFGAIDLDHFTNLGTINIQGPGIGHTSDSFVNGPSGIINILSGRYWIQPQPTFINQGTINIGPTGQLELYGAFNVTDLGEINRPSGGGLVLFRGLFFGNDGHTMALNANTGDYFLSGIGNQLGTLTGGRVTEAPGGSLLFGKQAGLSGVAVDGDLNLTSMLMAPDFPTDPPVEIPELHLLGGSTFTGQANLTTPGAQLLIDQDMTSENRFELAGSATRLAPGATRTLTLGASSIVNMTGADTILGSGTPANGDTLVNRGRIHAGPANDAGSDGSARIAAARFTNLGTVEATQGVLTIDSPGLQNLSGGALVGGTWKVSNASLVIGGNGSAATITTNRANVVLDGSGSRFDAINSLSLNDVSGELHLLAGRSFHAPGEFVNGGLLELEGGAFDATSIRNAGQIIGRGTVAGDLTSSGLIAPNGQLDVDGHLLLSKSNLLDIHLESRQRFDQFNVVGDAAIGGALSVELVSDPAVFSPDDVFTIVQASGVLSGGFSNIANGERIDVGIGTLLLTVASHEVTLSGFEAPEPSVLALLCVLGAAGLLRAYRADWLSVFQGSSAAD